MVLIRNILLATLFIMLLANGYTLIQKDKSFNININKSEVFNDEGEIYNSQDEIKTDVYKL